MTTRSHARAGVIVKGISLATSLVSLAVFLPGCVTLEEVNEGLRRMDRVWQLEYQKTEDEFRYRVIEAGYLTSFLAVKRTFLDLNMPVQSASTESGKIIAESTAPTPLTREEWKEIAKVENPRIKEIGGWFLVVREDPKDYIVSLVASLKPWGEKTLVLLDYSLDNPKLRAMGVVPARYAPPLAVQLASIKFWKGLTESLRGLKVSPPRKRRNDEMHTERAV